MASDLKWSKHIEQIVHKANRLLGLLKVGFHLKAVFTSLNVAFVPILTHSSSNVKSLHLEHLPMFCGFG